ncbi:hypothetical protein [Hyphomicrobium sp. LHD-15]|uniref:hypothetical protein n=1 Tax=Hyphomicrobium sp. LHD-15 TaxID=3072142 RepID=UPI00280D6784|nr:hypothetical protein [Hyphomicrobium sp. LHD-15]MDQ8699022.1 hypothetical protein [Hyphomicrobium sp. LHD-15]
MIGSPKEWASLLGFDRDTDEKTMAARARVLGKTLAYLETHFSDPDGARPSEELVIELGQFLILAEGMESKGRSVKFKELYETIGELHLHWDEIDRDAAFRAIAKKVAVIKGIVAFSDAWLGTASAVAAAPPAELPQVSPPFVFAEIDEADVKTRLVRPSHLR